MQMICKLPDWTSAFLQSQVDIFESMETKMRLAIALSQQNIHHNTGGPFGAAIFDDTTHTLIMPGINLVTSAHCSVLHAEIVAIILAQTHFNTYDLASIPNLSLTLYSSTEPCSMCLGAIGWSGIQKIVYGAHDQDARAIGFDEGFKPTKWQIKFKSKGIQVIPDICRKEAVSVLQQYLTQSGLIY